MFPQISKQEINREVSSLNFDRWNNENTVMERSKVNFSTKYDKEKKQAGKTFVSETDLEVSQLHFKKIIIRFKLI